MFEYLNKKLSVSLLVITLNLFCGILIIFLTILLLSKNLAANNTVFVFTLLVLGIIVLLLGGLSLKQGEADNHSVGSRETEDNLHINLIKDLQNENKYFAKILSHDLRSPLSSIVLLASYLKSKDGHPEINQYHELIEQSARKELEMAGTLLSIMRVNSLNTEQFVEINLLNKINEILLETESSHSQKQINIEVLTTADLTLSTDPPVFKLVLKNLVQQAIHYSDNGQQIRINTKEEEKQVVIEVVFNSSKFSKLSAEDLFNSDHLEQNGTQSFPENVHLYFCRKLIQHYNGTIHVQATDDDPACRFILTIEREMPQSTT